MEVHTGNPALPDYIHTLPLFTDMLALTATNSWKALTCARLELRQ